MKKTPKRGIILIIIVAMLSYGIALYFGSYHIAGESAEKVMKEPAEGIEVVDTGKSVSFIPEDPDTGLILYPGARVAYTAYAPIMELCARQGILTVIVRMPINFAFSDIDAANRIMEEYPQIDSWYLAGHSLGGAMACNYASRNQDKLQGLILLAAYSADDISDASIRTLSIVGERDGVINKDKLENRKQLLPNLSELVIEGGNHSGFADYKLQAGDQPSTIGAGTQWEITANGIVDFIQSGK